MELYIAANAGDVDHDRNHANRFVAYGLYLTMAFELLANGVVVVTAFAQGG